MPRKERADWKREFKVKGPQTIPIVKLAAYARSTTADVRRKFCTAFHATFDDELDKDATDQLADLNAHERAFCEGWAFLAELQCWDAATGKLDDTKLVAMIAAQMHDPRNPGDMTG